MIDRFKLWEYFSLLVILAGLSAMLITLVRILSSAGFTVIDTEPRLWVLIPEILAMGYAVTFTVYLMRHDFPVQALRRAKWLRRRPRG